MSAPKGSVGVALTVTVIIIIAVTSVGYYQFVYCASSSCSTSTSTASSGAAACAPPSCVTIAINVGAATLTTTAYSPAVATLVIGVNNTFQVLNNDSQSGGVFHSLTADSCAQSGQPCPFDTGVIAYGVTKGPFTLTTPGTYAYYCVVHPTTMIGKIIVLAGSGSSGGGAPSSSSTTTKTSTSSSSSVAQANGLPISIYNGAGNQANPPGYAPDNFTIVIGVNNTVTWTNNDTSAHTVTSMVVPAGAETFNSGIISKGGVYTLTLTVPGTYEYICSLHAWMKGTFIVKSG
jgi:plastocyanin